MITMTPKFIEFESVFGKPNSPKLKVLCRLNSILLVDINIARDKKEYNDDYFVWLTLTSNTVGACYRGTLSECYVIYNKIKSLLLQCELDEEFIDDDQQNIVVNLQA